MTEWIKLELIVDPPASYRAEQLGWTYEEPRRLARRRTMVEPAGPCLFRILEPSLMRAFSYRDVIEAVPLGGDVWRFSRVFTKSPYRQTFLSPELLIAWRLCGQAFRRLDNTRASPRPTF